MKAATKRVSSATGGAVWLASVLLTTGATSVVAAPAGAEEPASEACTRAVDVAALVRALESRLPAGSAGWEIGVRGSDCIVTVTDGGGLWLSGIRADRETMLVAAEVSWTWLHHARSVADAQTSGRGVADETALQARIVGTSAVPAAIAAQPPTPPVSPPNQRAEGRVGLGATALNGQAVSTLTAGYSVPVSAAFRAGAEGWCSLARVDSQFLYVDSSLGSSARPGVQVASLGGFLSSSSRWAGLDFGVRSGLGLVWAQSTLASELASVSESAWLPEASVHGRLGVRIGAAEPAIEIGYRAVVGDEKVVGPSLWAFAGPSASLSLGWSVQ
jgi:hypothetical protein